jgi:orotate phosphoribosyltransferase
MPIYNDNRMLIARPEHRALIRDAFEQMLGEHGFECDVIAGIATAGIPHATSLADALQKPLVYVRGASKGHGLGNMIEGVARDGDLAGKRVVLIEDLISTGGSSIAAVRALRQTGAEVPACLAIFSYGLDKARRTFAEQDPPCECLPILEYDAMIEVALENGYVDEQESAALLEWREDPLSWGERHGFPPEKE